MLSGFELKKFRRKGSAKPIYFAIVFAAISFYVSSHLGIQSSHAIYTYRSPEKIESPLFVEGENPDIEIVGRDVYITGEEKSVAALDDYMNYLDEKYTKMLEERYGDKAFPVFVYPVYIKRTLTFERETATEKEETAGRVAETPPPKMEKTGEGGEGKEAEAEKTLLEILGVKKEESVFVTPENFEPPSLLDKIVAGFVFVIPAYFVMQAYTSSLLEDVRNRRIEILLTLPKSKHRILVEILLPYLIFSLLILILLSVIFRVNAVLFVFPVIVFMFVLQTFLSLSSRSYREATFLLLTSNLFITSYLFLPAIFTGLPLSEISPITYFLKSFEERVSLTDTLFSMLPIFVLTAFFFILSSNALSPEITYSYSGIGEKFVNSLKGLTRNPVGVVFTGVSLVSAALIVEFFLLFIATTFLYPILFLLAFFALFEEILKCSAIESNPRLTTAVILPVSFFSFEKFLLLWSVLSRYGELLLGSFLLLPLFAHLISSLSFYFTRRLGFRVALLTAFALHFAYNAAVVL
ncbi:MAG: hypothetical protein ABWW66_03875 [Archaeoglobaceae archaeon]